MTSSISTVDWIVAAMLSGKQIIHIQQMDERNTMHIYELLFLKYQVESARPNARFAGLAPTTVFRRSESKKFQPVQVLQQDGPLHQRDQSSTALAVDHRPVQVLQNN